MSSDNDTTMPETRQGAVMAHAGETLDLYQVTADKAHSPTQGSDGGQVPAMAHLDQEEAALRNHRVKATQDHASV